MTVGTFEAKTKFSELLDKVERGEEIIVTRHGKAVARIVPEGLQDKSGAVAERILARRRGIGQRLEDAGQRSITPDEIKNWVNEGRN